MFGDKFKSFTCKFITFLKVKSSYLAFAHIRLFCCFPTYAMKRNKVSKIAFYETNNMIKKKIKEFFNFHWYFLFSLR